MAIDRTALGLTFTQVSDALNGVGSWSPPGPLTHGDTLRLPAGAGVWTTPLTISKNIKLIGQTTVTLGAKVNGKAAITFTLNSLGSQTALRYTGTGTGLIYVTTDNADKPLIQGITFDGNNNLDTTSGSALGISGASKQIRITQCHFKYNVARSIIFNPASAPRETCGVMDHCVHEQSNGTEHISVRHDQYQPSGSPGSYIFGDGSFLDGPQFGQVTKAWYFEDCIFLSWSKVNVGQIGQMHGGIDLEAGGRRIVRHCYMACVPISSHGTETGGYRGGRVQEVYSNIIDQRDPDIGLNTGNQNRAGTFILWDNDVWGRTDFKGWIATAYRQPGYFVNIYRDANGVHPLDANATTSSTDTNFVYDPAEAPKDFWAGWPGTITGTGTLTATFSQSPPTAPAGGWTNFVIRRVGAANQKMLINTIVGTAVTFRTGTSINALTFFPAGTSIQVHRIVASLDQSTAGKSDRINSGVDPAVNVDYPGQWPHQRSEPHYAWMNTISRGTTVNTADYATPGGNYTNALIASDTNPTLAANKNVFNQVGGIQTSPTSPFNGSSGVGYGTLANRPTTFTYVGGAQPQSDPSMPAITNIPYVAYWATDQQKLYVATANNTWTEYYQPAIYPHPLVETPVSQKIISLTGPGLIFGNVLVGEAPTTTLTVANTGDTLLTITSPVVYPTGFTGLTTGFTVAAGATHDITVTFTPLLEQVYSGNIIFNSDADSGSETIAASGTGVAPAEEGGKGRGHKKGALSRRA